MLKVTELYVTSLVVHIRLKKINHFNTKKNKNKKNNKCINKKAPKKGISFFTQKTVKLLWYVKWSREEGPQCQWFGPTDKLA